MPVVDRGQAITHGHFIKNPVLFFEKIERVAQLNQVTDADLKFFRHDRFGHEIVGARAQHLDAPRRVVEARNGQDRELAGAPRQRADLADDVEAGHRTFEHVIHQHQVEGLLRDQCQRRFAAGGLRGFESEAGEQAPEMGRLGGAVFDQQHVAAQARMRRGDPAIDEIFEDGRLTL